MRSARLRPEKSETAVFTQFPYIFTVNGNAVVLSAYEEGAVAVVEPSYKLLRLPHLANFTRV